MLLTDKDFVITDSFLNKAEKEMESCLRRRSIDGVWMSTKNAKKILEIIRQFPRSKIL